MLLDMTRTTARVDVISGTSAGGVNGAAMSIALLYGGDFSQLRNVWLTTGAFADLLRPPLGENPGSLLMGEEFFLPHIQEAFESLAASSTPQLDPHVMPLDLRLTTTLLSGRQGNSVDELGIKVHDVDCRAYFHFRHTPEKDDFTRSEVVVPLLSRAARSTASFPFSFEPSLVAAVREIKEIAWLSVPSAVTLPDALPVCAAAVTIRLHFGVLHEELPELLLAVAADRSEGADSAGPSEALLMSLGANGDKTSIGVPTRPLSPEEARRSLRHGLIGGRDRLSGLARRPWGRLSLPNNPRRESDVTAV